MSISLTCSTKLTHKCKSLHNHQFPPMFKPNHSTYNLLNLDKNEGTKMNVKDFVVFVQKWRKSTLILCSACMNQYLHHYKPWQQHLQQKIFSFLSFLLSLFVSLVTHFKISSRFVLLKILLCSLLFSFLKILHHGNTKRMKKKILWFLLGYW